MKVLKWIILLPLWVVALGCRFVSWTYSAKYRG
jgi:hypothetical protein